MTSLQMILKGITGNKQMEEWVLTMWHSLQYWKQGASQGIEGL